MGQGAGFAVDGHAERRQAHLPGFVHGHPCIPDAVAGVVDIQVVRLAVGDDQQQAAAGRLCSARMLADWRMAAPIRV